MASMNFHALGLDKAVTAFVPDEDFRRFRDVCERTRIPAYRAAGDALVAWTARVEAGDDNLSDCEIKRPDGMPVTARVPREVWEAFMTACKTTGQPAYRAAANAVIAWTRQAEIAEVAAFNRMVDDAIAVRQMLALA